MKWKFWIAKHANGYFIVWDQISVTIWFGPYSEQEAEERLSAFEAAVERETGKPCACLSTDDLPERAKVQ